MTMMLVICFIIFYPAAIYFSFHAYREFTGMLYDNGMGGGQGGLGGMLPNLGRGSMRRSTGVDGVY